MGCMYTGDIFTQTVDKVSHKYLKHTFTQSVIRLFAVIHLTLMLVSGNEFDLFLALLCHHFLLLKKVDVSANSVLPINYTSFLPMYYYVII